MVARWAVGTKQDCKGRWFCGEIGVNLGGQPSLTPENQRSSEAEKLEKGAQH
jgi:hypothetical protein